MNPTITGIIKKGIGLANESLAAFVYSMVADGIIILLCLIALHKTQPPKRVWNIITQKNEVVYQHGDIGSHDWEDMKVWMKQSWPTISACIVLGGIPGLWFGAGVLGCLAIKIRGRTINIKEFKTQANRFFLPYLNVTIMICAAAGAAFGILMSGFYILRYVTVLNTLFDRLVWVLLCVGTFIWVSNRLSLWTPALALENSNGSSNKYGPIESMESSFEMSKGYWWRLAGIIFIPGFIVQFFFRAIGFLGLLSGTGTGHYIGLSVYAVVKFYLSFVILASRFVFYQERRTSSKQEVEIPDGLPEIG